MRNEPVNAWIKLPGNGNEWVDSTHFSTLSLSSLKSQTVWKMAKKSHPTNHSRALCAISAEECQHFSGFWSLFGTHTHTYTLGKKEMGYYVKDCIFFGLHAFPTHSRFSHSLHLLINGHSVRGSREVKLITLIDFEANKPKTHTHTHTHTQMKDTKKYCKRFIRYPLGVRRKILTVEYTSICNMKGSIKFMGKA